MLLSLDELLGYLVIWYKSCVATPPWKLCVQVIGLFGYLVEISCGDPFLETISVQVSQMLSGTFMVDQLVS